MQRDGQRTDERGADSGRSLSRRRFLKGLGLIGAGAVAGAAGAGALADLVAQAVAEAAEPGAAGSAAEADLAAHQWMFLIDLRKCDGCERCTEACQKQHYLAKEQTWIKVYKLKAADGQEFFMPRPCMQCENAPCVRVCPVQATYKSPDGITLVDQTKCIGCRMCMAACPYEARYFNWGDPPKVPSTLPAPRPEWPVPQQRGTVGKCVFCVHDLRVGKLPACVEGCPMGALYAGDLNADLAVNGLGEVIKLSEFLKANDVVRFKEELGTRPRVYYVLGHGQLVDF